MPQITWNVYLYRSEERSTIMRGKKETATRSNHGILDLTRKYWTADYIKYRIYENIPDTIFIDSFTDIQIVRDIWLNMSPAKKRDIEIFVLFRETNSGRQGFERSHMEPEQVKELVLNSGMTIAGIIRQFNAELSSKTPERDIPHIGIRPSTLSSWLRYGNPQQRMVEFLCKICEQNASTK